MIGIKLDLEAEVHLTARIRGDIIVGLYWEGLVMSTGLWMGEHFEDPEELE